MKKKQPSNADNKNKKCVQNITNDKYIITALTLNINYPSWLNAEQFYLKYLVCSSPIYTAYL